LKVLGVVLLACPSEGCDRRNLVTGVGVCVRSAVVEGASVVGVGVIVKYVGPFADDGVNTKVRIAGGGGVGIDGEGDADGVVGAAVAVVVGIIEVVAVAAAAAAVAVDVFSIVVAVAAIFVVAMQGWRGVRCE
jgi:hypothetical protein